MFSTGQIIFGIIFAICFLIAIVYMYKEDLKIHKTHYKGTKWVVIAFFGFIALLFLLKAFLKQ